jgi:hypothetical protein
MRGFRRAALSVLVALVALVPSEAQVYQFATPLPRITAASAAWQLSGEPVLFAGDDYHATAERVFFDGNVMVQVGSYKGVPLYVDATIEPYSIVYVPVGSNLMRRYERLRTGAAAGTEGSRTPWFPVGPTGSAPAVEEGLAEVVGTTGSSPVLAPQVAPTMGACPSPPGSAPSRRISIETALRPEGNRGLWIRYLGTRWYAAGPAVPHEPEKFAASGDYRGFPVFRARGSPSDEVYIPVVLGGWLTPYRRR